MINQDKWIDSLPKTNIKFSEEKNQIDHDKWINTISKKNTYNSFNKYTLMTVLFVCGLLFVSVVKNGARNLEKEINNLRTSISKVKFDLDQAILDNEVINSPENISRLAKEHLETDFITYKKSQIKQLGKDTDIIIKPTKKNNNLSTKIKLKIENKKAELKKLQALYSKPETIPGEIKMKVAKTIKEKKTELKNLYTSPKETIQMTKVQKWAAVQVVKVFLGVPIVPGK